MAVSAMGKSPMPIDIGEKPDWYDTEETISGNDFDFF
jgi:hypothetical protein